MHLVKVKQFLLFLVLLGLAVSAAPSPGPSSSPRKRVLVASLGVLGHAVPLARIGAEIVHQCCSRGTEACIVDFASNTPAESWWEQETISVGDSNCLGDFIDLGPLPDTWYDKLERISTDPSLFRGTLSVFTDLYLELLPVIYDEIDEYMRDVDVALVDVGTLGAMEKARALNVTLVIHSPTIWADTFGQFEPPHWLPAFGSGLTKEMSLTERCLNALLPRLLSVALQPALMRVNKMRFDSGMPPYFSSHQVFQDLRIISSTALGFEFPRLVPQLHAYVGPILPRRAKPHSMPKHVKSFLEKNYNSRLVVVRFRATLNLDLNSLIAFRTGLEWFASKENVAIIWFSTQTSWKVLRRSSSPRFLFLSKFHVDTYLALFRLTTNPRAMLSISSCGMAAVQEPLMFGVPVLCVPLVADQADVAARLKSSRAGIVIAKEDITAREVLLALNRLSTSDSYQKNAQVVKSLLRMAGGRERAALHVLSAFHPSHESFLKLNKSFSWHKRVGLDVSAVMASILITVASTCLVYLRYRHGQTYGF